MGYTDKSVKNFSSRFSPAGESGSEARSLGLAENLDRSSGKLTQIFDFLQEIVSHPRHSLSAASIQKHLALGREPPRHAPRRFGNLFGIAGEANPKVAFAAGTEGAARRGANAGFVDEPKRQRTGIGKAVD